MRWGILGTGSICRQFAQDLPFAPDAVALAVASRDLNRARLFAQQHRIARCYGSYAELLADPDIDIVYIGTPHSEHLANAGDAMRAGKHVLCEKPLTVTPEESRKLKQIQAETGRYLMEAMWTWFLPAIIQARNWVSAGRIGSLRHIKADFGYPQRFDPTGRMYNPDLAGGCLLDMGVYPVALSWLFHRQMPDEISVVGRRAPSGVDDDFSALLDYDNHVSTIGASFRCKLQNWAYIIGTEGYITVPDFWRASEAMLYQLDTKIDHFSDDRLHQGFAYEAIAVQQDIAAGRWESETMSLDDSIAIQTIMDRIRQII